MYIIPNIYICV